MSASLILLCVFREVPRVFVALSNAEAPYQLISNELYFVGFSLLVGIFAMQRLVILALSESRPYYQIGISWFLLAFVLAIYIWASIPNDTPQPQCTETGLCFGIYDMRNNTNFIVLGAVFYLLGSSLRFFLTAVYAITRRPYL
ncbi:MAG: hypothetical protein ACRD6X_16445 [Pyrinomonadaceae bacterium]